MPPLKHDSLSDLPEVPARLAAACGPEFWRSLEELTDSEEFRIYLDREFPGFSEPLSLSLDRREFLRLTAASLALAGLSGCEGPPQKWLVPYERSPELMAPGQPLFFATAAILDGYAHPVLVESNMGRPTKVEGNPVHPASLGATDIFAQASVLDLWDPDRSQTVVHRGRLALWDDFLSAITARLTQLTDVQGEGLRLLTETLTSPTLDAQLQALLARFPKAQWHSYQPLGTGNAYEGARMAFGEPVECRYRFDKASVILAIDADFLGQGPGHLRHARDFAARRIPDDEGKAMNRLYVLESVPSVTGAVADHRWPVRACDVEALAHSIAHELGVPGVAPATTPSSVPPPWLKALVKDLRQQSGSSLVIAGERQPPQVHALVHAMNHALGNIGATVEYSAPVPFRPENPNASLSRLAKDMAEGRVDTLLILGGNPVYNAPSDLNFGGLLAKTGFSCHLSLYEDETSGFTDWHIPQAHFLESWGDARAFDGSVSILQPLIAPLYGGKSVHEFLAACLDEPLREGHDIVRENWRSQYGGEDFDTFWNNALKNGWMPDTAYPTRKLAPVTKLTFAPPPSPAATAGHGLEIIFAPDPTIGDGRFANNGWLQELPKPVLGLTWDNAALLGPELAERLGLLNEDVAELRYRGRQIEAPVWIVPGQADGVVILTLGYGRNRGGHIAAQRGYNAYALRHSDRPWFDDVLEIRKTGRRQALAAVQHHHAMVGRPIVQTATLTEYRENPNFARLGGEPEESLYPPRPSPGYSWGMSIDLNRCIGCNACTVACQAENNIPVVGKEEVIKGREMHWIRVDRYYRGDAKNPQTFFQPVPCMHCEKAPCEYVCPVEASIHDSEGLNVQVYNRCIGTRFCSNNCPYKVRRFNFFKYSDSTPSLKAQKNPDVTVRWRGVMEKCTYCLQRISAARIAAEKENRKIRDGEVVTACQAVCPAEAIVFGDLNDPASRVNASKASPRRYALLAELNIRPRTTYLARVSNPNPDVEKG